MRNKGWVICSQSRENCGNWNRYTKMEVSKNQTGRGSRAYDALTRSQSFFFLLFQKSIFVFMCFDVIKTIEKKGKKKVENNETKWQVQSVINRNDFLAHFYDITPQSRAKCGTVLNVWWSKSCWGIKSRRVGGKMIFLYFIFMYKLW